MIQITKEIDGFTISAFPNEIILLVFDTTFWYSQTKYYGHCSVGTPTPEAVAAGFQTQADVDVFIASNNLLKFGVPLREFHEDATFQLFMTDRQANKLINDYPALSSYLESAGINRYEEREGWYMYLNFFEPNHRDLLSQYSTITER